MNSLSICIPCGAAHVKYLEECLRSITSSTVLPDEIVVAVSGVEDEGLVRQTLEGLTIPKSIEFKTIISKEKRTAGLNRNLLGKEAGGSIISFVDADDFVHRERNFHLKEMFESKEVFHVVHSFKSNPPINQDEFDNMIITNAEVCSFNDLIPSTAKSFSYRMYGSYGHFERICGSKFNCAVHNGAVTIRKEVLDFVRFKERRSDWIIAEDQDFNYETLLKFNRNYMIKAPLYLYSLSDRTNGGY